MTRPSDEKRWLNLPSRSRARIDADVRDELEGWIAERATELRATGVADEPAMRRAREEFGDLEAAQRYCASEDAASERQSRAQRWFDELRTDLRMAWRLARRTPTTTAVLLVTFALGIGATTAVYSAVHAVSITPSSM